MVISTPVAGVFLERSALAAGFLAAVIAVGGFIGRARSQVGDAAGVGDLQRPTTIGGVFGLGIGILILFLDALVG